MNAQAVNTAIERLNELIGADVAIIGELSLDFEASCITYLPRGERLPDSDLGLYKSSVWTRFDLDAIGQREEWLRQFDGRNVILQGTLDGSEPGYDGCGRFCLARVMGGQPD